MTFSRKKSGAVLTGWSGRISVKMFYDDILCDEKRVVS